MPDDENGPSKSATMALVSYVWPQLRTLCTRGPCSTLILPSRSDISRLIQSSFPKDEAQDLIEKLSQIPGGIQTIALERGAFFPEEVGNAMKECEDVRITPKVGYRTLFDKVRARKEVAILRHPRMYLKKKKKSGQRYRRYGCLNNLDISGSNEESLRLVECLPQGSRRTQAPLIEFQRAVKAVAGENVKFEDLVEISVFLDEFARWRLKQFVESEKEASMGKMPTAKKTLKKQFALQARQSEAIAKEYDGRQGLNEDDEDEAQIKPYSLSEE